MVLHQGGCNGATSMLHHVVEGGTEASWIAVEWVFAANGFVEGIPPPLSLPAVAAGKVDYLCGMLIVTVCSARNLRNADAGVPSEGLSDPYVNVVVPSGGEKPLTKRSEPVKDSLFPVWNKKLSFRINRRRELTHEKLLFEVYDDDPGLKGDDFLGEAEVDWPFWDEGGTGAYLS